eukprot:6088422-Prymnesium_polylepis.3
MLASLALDELCCVLKQLDFTTATNPSARGRHDYRSKAVRSLMSCGSTCKLLRQLADEMLATWLSVRMSIGKAPIEISEIDELQDLFWAVGT